MLWNVAVGQVLRRGWPQGRVGANITQTLVVRVVQGRAAAASSPCCAESRPRRLWHVCLAGMWEVDWGG